MHGIGVYTDLGLKKYQHRLHSITVYFTQDARRHMPLAAVTIIIRKFSQPTKTKPCLVAITNDNCKMPYNDSHRDSPRDNLFYT